MSKLVNNIHLCLLLLGMVSCSDYDNYDPPQETLRGAVTDKTTQEPLQVEAADGGIRIRLLEYSWSDNPTPYYFFSMQDGTFNNTKIFKGNYNILPEGPFVPLQENESQTMDIAGVAEANFQVEPFLRVEWIEQPQLDAEGHIIAKVKITRGTSNPDYQQNITDAYFFINSNPYVGNNNFDNRFSVRRDFNGAEANDLPDGTITLTSTGDLPGNRTYYLRVGARTDYTVAGIRRYNYTTVLPIKLP